MRTPLILGFGLLAACTGIVGNNGGDDDNMPPPPPPTTDVRIVVHDGVTAQPGVQVIFANADDSVVADTMTGADGSATAQLPNGGNLTVIRTYAPLKPGDPPRPAEVFSYVGVKAGDVLELGKEIDELATPAAINVILPTATGQADIITQCGRGQGAAPNVPITVKGCASMVDFYVTDQNQTSFYKRVPYGSNADLSGEQLQEALGATITATHTDPAITINAEIRIVAGNYQLASSGVQRIDQTPANVNLPNVMGLDQLVVAAIATQAGGTQMVATRSAYVASPVTVDGAAGILPYVATPIYTPTGVTWTETGPGTADYVITALTVTDPANPTNPGYTWTVVAPHTGLSLTLPVLQGAAATYNPTATEQIVGTHGIASVSGGYDVARTHAFTVHSVIQLAPIGGSATLSYAGTPPTR